MSGTSARTCDPYIEKVTLRLRASAASSSSSAVRARAWAIEGACNIVLRTALDVVGANGGNIGSLKFYGLPTASRERIKRIAYPRWAAYSGKKGYLSPLFSSVSRSLNCAVAPFPSPAELFLMTKDETKNSSGELPLDYRSAFCEAVMRFRDEWNPAAPEFRLDISGKPFALSDLCGLVVGLGDHLPTNVLNRLLSEMHNARYTRLKVELADDPSYPTAARCLLRLMNDSRAALHRLDEERFRAPGVKLWDKQGTHNGSE